MNVSRDMIFIKQELSFNWVQVGDDNEMKACDPGRRNPADCGACAEHSSNMTGEMTVRRLSTVTLSSSMFFSYNTVKDTEEGAGDLLGTNL